MTRNEPTRARSAVRGWGWALVRTGLRHCVRSGDRPSHAEKLHLPVRGGTAIEGRAINQQPVVPVPVPVPVLVVRTGSISAISVLRCGFTNMEEARRAGIRRASTAC